MFNYRGVNYEAYVLKEYANADRLAIRIVVNNDSYLYIWGKGYPTPQGWKTNVRPLDLKMVIDAFVNLRLVSDNARNINTQERVVNSPTVSYNAELEAMKEQMRKMQENMELMMASVVQNAQIVQQKIQLDGMNMNINSYAKPEENFVDNTIEFNFKAVEEYTSEESELYFDDIELDDEVAMTSTVETRVEEIVEDPKPRRRAASRE